MPKSKSPKGGERTTRGRRNARLDDLSKGTARIVQDAAALLDEELASGIVTAGRVQRRLRKEQRVDPQDFAEALQRFQADAHQVLTLLSGRIDEMRQDKNFEIVSNLFERSHDMVDLAVELVNNSAEVASQLANSSILKREKGGRGERNNNA